MSEIIINQIKKARETNSKIKIVTGDDETTDNFVHYGFVVDNDEEFVVINLENKPRTATIKLNSIKEVVVYNEL